jgi:hypothetical protein
MAIVHPLVTIPCAAWLVNLQTLTVEAKLALFNREIWYWDRFLKLLKAIPSRQLRMATYVTSTPSNTVPAGDADKDWEEVESIVTQRAWAQGERTVAKLCLHLRPRTNEEVRRADALVRGLHERSCRLVKDGWMAVSIM